MTEDDQGEWLNLTQAAHRLGWPRERLRSVARRQKVRTMRGNGGELLVLVTPGLGGQATVGHSQPGGLNDLTGVAGQGEVADLRAELMEATRRAAEAEGENRVLRAALEREQTRADRLEARLALPWWRRLIGGG